MKAHKLRSYWKDEEGNFAILSAVALLLILLAAGLAINALQLHDRKQELNAAADAAVLAAVKAVSDEISVIETTDWRKIGNDIGTKLFEENIRKIEGIGDVKYDIQLNTGVRNRDVTGKLTYSVPSETFLSAIMGRDNVTISNSAEAQKTLFKFARINFMIDVSSSMGIGADNANQLRLKNENGCAFACHGRANQANTVVFAREQGIRLRIDTIKDALTQVVSILEKTGARREFEIGLYTFSNSVVEQLSPTTNLAAVKNSIRDIEISGETLQGGTNVQFSLNQLSGMISAGGDGKRANSRQSNIPDGRDPNFMNFPPFETHGVQTIQSFDPDSCDIVKRQNHTLAFLNPAYLIPNLSGLLQGTRDKFTFIQNTLIPDITENSQFCSTNPAFAFSAQTEAEVEQAAIELFNDLLGESVRLSK